MVMGVYDQASHYALKSDPAAFFLWRIRRFVDRFTFLGWLDTTTLAFPGEPDRVCDTVAEFARAKARDRDACWMWNASPSRIQTCWSDWANMPTGCAGVSATEADKKASIRS